MVCSWKFSVNASAYLKTKRNDKNTYAQLLWAEAADTYDSDTDAAAYGGDEL